MIYSIDPIRLSRQSLPTHGALRPSSADKHPSPKYRLATFGPREDVPTVWAHHKTPCYEELIELAGMGTADYPQWLR